MWLGKIKYQRGVNALLPLASGCDGAAPRGALLSLVHHECSHPASAAEHQLKASSCDFEGDVKLSPTAFFMLFLDLGAGMVLFSLGFWERKLFFLFQSLAHFLPALGVCSVWLCPRLIRVDNVWQWVITMWDRKAKTDRFDIKQLQKWSFFSLSDSALDSKGSLVRKDFVPH